MCCLCRRNWGRDCYLSMFEISVASRYYICTNTFLADHTTTETAVTDAGYSISDGMDVYYLCYGVC